MTRTQFASEPELRASWLPALSCMAMAGLMVGAFAPVAQAGGFFETLFAVFGGGAPHRAAAPYAYSDPSADLGARPDANIGSETSASGSWGGGRAFCVRLCDGRYYPITSGGSNSTPVHMCSAMCPAAKTKVFHGGEIDAATDSAGGRYANLEQAFAYRKIVVPNCTCNGKDAFGLVPVDVMTDPTLRAGDIVATSTGLKAFQGGKSETHKAAEFAPAENSTRVSGSLRDRLSGLRVSEKQ